MADVERLLREYGHEVDDRCPPITPAELGRHLESIAVDERGPDGLTVDYLRQSDEAAAPAQRWRLVAAVAAMILVVVSVVVVADGNNGDNTTGVSSSPGPAASDASPDEAPSQEWFRIPHDGDVFGGSIMRDVTVGGPGLVAVGATAGAEDPLAAATADTAAVVWTSVDGITWARAPHDEAVFGGAVMHAVTAHGQGLVAVGFDSRANSGAVVWTSPDGITWTRLAHDEAVLGGEEHASMTGVTAHGTGMVAIGEARTDGIRVAAVWNSTDGITWTRLPTEKTLFRGAFMVDVTAVGSLLVAVGESGSAMAVWTSVDGIEWSRVVDDAAISGPAALWSVAATETGLVAVGWDQSNDDSVAVVWRN